MPVLGFLGFGQTQRACPETHVAKRSSTAMGTAHATEDFIWRVGRGRRREKEEGERRRRKKKGKERKKKKKKEKKVARHPITCKSGVRLQLFVAYLIGWETGGSIRPHSGLTIGLMK